MDMDTEAWRLEVSQEVADPRQRFSHTPLYSGLLQLSATGGKAAMVLLPPHGYLLLRSKGDKGQLCSTPIAGQPRDFRARL